MAFAELWWDIARDETRRDTDRLEASKLLADRGWGKAAVFEPQEGDPLDLAALEGAAESSGRGSFGLLVIRSRSRQSPRRNRPAGARVAGPRLRVGALPGPPQPD